MIFRMAGSSGRVGRLTSAIFRLKVDPGVEH